jgi:hypothetical protein
MPIARHNRTAPKPHSSLSNSCRRPFIILALRRRLRNNRAPLRRMRGQKMESGKPESWLGRITNPVERETPRSRPTFQKTTSKGLLLRRLTMARTCTGSLTIFSCEPLEGFAPTV